VQHGGCWLCVRACLSVFGSVYIQGKAGTWRVTTVSGRCSVLQRVAARIRHPPCLCLEYTILWGRNDLCVAACCSVLQRVAARIRHPPCLCLEYTIYVQHLLCCISICCCVSPATMWSQPSACFSTLQRVAVCCRLSWDYCGVAIIFRLPNILWGRNDSGVTVCCSVLQCVAARIRLPGILASIVWPWGRSDLCVAVCLQCIAVCRSASRMPGMVCSIFLKKENVFHLAPYHSFNQLYPKNPQFDKHVHKEQSRPNE